MPGGASGKTASMAFFMASYLRASTRCLDPGEMMFSTSVVGPFAISCLFPFDLCEPRTRGGPDFRQRRLCFIPDLHETLCARRELTGLCRHAIAGTDDC
jgi:hypothetical protein